MEKFARSRGLVPQRLYEWRKKLEIKASRVPRRSTLCCNCSRCCTELASKAGATPSCVAVDFHFERLKHRWRFIRMRAKGMPGIASDLAAQRTSYAG